MPPLPLASATSGRIDQLLSRFGYCSRREARDWLKAGRVRCADAVIRTPEYKARASDVLIDGEPIPYPDGFALLLNKPAGLVCSHDEREGRRVYDLFPPLWNLRTPPLTTVGRLDKDSTGALLLTDMGDLVHRWTSPKHKVEKVYVVELDRNIPQPGVLESLFLSGEIELDGKPCLPARMEQTGLRCARVTLLEGRYHQVKRMFSSQGLTVTSLHRERFGGYDVSNLAEGEWKILVEPYAMDEGVGVISGGDGTRSGSVVSKESGKRRRPPEQQESPLAV